MGDSILTEYRSELSWVLLILSGFASFIGILGAVLGPILPDPWGLFQDLITPFGNWIYWLAFLGPLSFLIILWWAMDYFFKVRKFRDLIDIGSKAKFIKNLDEIEYIAWRLPKRFKIRVYEKKKELKIKE